MKIFVIKQLIKKKKKEETIKIKNLEEMIKLKGKINLQTEKSNEEIKNKKEEKNETTEKKEKDPYEDKCDKLLFFKEIISNLEVIYNKLNILRAKGFNIPIVINVEIKYSKDSKVSYILNGKEKNVNEIIDYLFEINNNYENELSIVLETKKYLRFLYGKLFRKIRQHQEGNFDIPEIKRYILNKTSIDDTIIEAENINNIPLGEDYEKQHRDYTKQIFESMSQYLISLFNTNKLDFDKLYDDMKIKEDYKNIKGISIKTCENESIEEYILYLYEEYVGKLPIAQNILICSKETSIEEIQSFLYRAILCDYHTLFVIEILKSFSNYQHNKMYGYIDKLLSIKLEKYKKDNKKDDVYKEKTRIYLDSKIVFVYKDKDLDKEIEIAFKNELGKYIKNSKDENFSIPINKGDENEKEGENKMGDLSVSNIIRNSIGSFQDNDLLKKIKVITSDVCGLGKSFKIKKMIKDQEKKYYHFPLGGKLTKNEIYQKVFDLFETIKKDAKEEAKKSKKKEDKEDKDKNDEKYSEFNKVAIHLDLIETKDISLINEFLFSFLITKFYTNNENIIYIPNNMQIYIEVPNSFENYLTKFGILNAFNKENIIQGELNQSETYNVKMLPLELEPDIRENFKRLNEIEDDKKIEQFIKYNFNSIGIKEYSYHQVQTFIKLYISQFDSFEGKGKLKFVNSQGKDITKETIEYFVNSTKYFTNGGFAKAIMEKKHIKDKFKLLSDAYDSDLSKVDEKEGRKSTVNFDIPLVFIDKKENKIIFEKFPEEENKGTNKIFNKNVDIVYLIDATGSMGAEIKAAKENVIDIFNKLKKNYKDYNFRFGSVFYRDKIDVKDEKDEYFQLTDDMKELEKNIGTVKASGGGDGPEDWVGGYEIALNDMKWRNGIKLIIHIADAGAHGTEFSEGDEHTEQGILLPPKIEECVKRNINIIGFKISDYPKKSFDKIREIYNDYKLKNKDFGQFIEIYEFDRKNDEAVSNNFNKLVMEAANQVINSSYKYLKRLKKILCLPNDLEKDIAVTKDKILLSLLSILDKDTDNYVITDDNYKKMLLLVYRIKADVPVIIMGETGCGKTSLIKKLSQILNNGEELVEIFNIHPGITDEEISKKMIEMNEKANNKKYKNKELWVFFDEINTCLSMSLLTEIFINRTFNGKKLEKNIRLIGACNPYRKRNGNIERCGLTREDDDDDQLVYKVEQLPQSLLYYVFSFGSLKDEDEKKYIKSIIEKLFDKEEEKLLDLTTEAISKCHIFLRTSFGNDPSVVSLREIARFVKCVEFFQDYFFKKEDFIKIEEQKEYSSDDETKKLYKIKSIICSIYLCYYIRLTNEEKRGNFENKLQEILLQIANVYCPENKENQIGNLTSKIRYQKLINEIRQKNFKQFSDLLKFEEEFLLNQIEKDKGIGENQLLKENLFLLFLAVVTKIPLIIVGKPGTGKSLSSQLIYNSMRGKYSKPTKNGNPSFFSRYPQINQIYFQGSKSTTPEDIEELFKKADDLCDNYKHDKHSHDQVPIYMILFDELGLAEKAPTKPLKVIHSKLEYKGKTEGTCFIGISNYSLDAAKINRALSLSVPNLEDKLDQLKSTAYSIVKSISEDASYQDNLIFDLLSRTYHEYKKWLIFIKKLTVLKIYFDSKKKEDKENLRKNKNFGEIENDQEYIKLFKIDKIIKTEFHGNRDFYNIIKGVAIEGNKLSSISDQTQIVPIINKFIERNFGGICYDIDIDFELEFEDTKERMAKLKNEILYEKLSGHTNKKGRGKGGNKEKKDEKENIKVTSVFLFKKIYNEACILESKDNNSLTNYQIGKDDVVKYNLNDRINENINDNNSRYLLLEISSNLAPLIVQNIKSQNSYRENIDFINGSPFSDDISNNDYKTKKVSEIQNWASQKDKLIVLQNLDQIQAYLYDLYNMNYKIIEDQKFVRICVDNFSEQLTPVNDTFKIIVLVGKEFVNETDMAFLNRLEKMQISYKELLDNEQKELINNIQDEIRLKEVIKKKKYNYDLYNLLINCREKDLGGLVYYFSSEAKKEKIEKVNDFVKEKIFNKMSILLPEDIVLILDSEILKDKYFEKKKYYNFKQYMKSLSVDDKDLCDFKISIIYTFSNIANIIEGYNNDEGFMISEINTEEALKTKINDNKNKKKGRFILIRFEYYNSNKMQFVADFIKCYCKEDDYHYIFIVYLNRNFNFDTIERQRIYSIPNIDDKINQLFIDNLEGPEIKLDSLLNQSIKDIMFSDAFSDLDKEFKDSLNDFIYDKFPKKNKFELDQNNKMLELSFYLNQKYGEKNQENDIDKYIDEITNYFQYDDIDFKNAIISKAKELIESDEDASKDDCYDLVNKMLGESYMNENKIDIISTILGYIKENVFIKYLKYIFNVLEDNNIFTTLLEINQEKSCKLEINDKGTTDNNSKIIKDIQTKFLKEIKYNDKEYKPKFISNYKIPGFYNFYKNLSDYLTKNITNEYLNNEKKLRNLDLDENLNIVKEKTEFNGKEEDLLQKVKKVIESDKLYYDILVRIVPDLLLKDYITYFLEKYLGIFSKTYYNIIAYLLKLRFSDETNIIKNNENNQINILLIKIMWIESNTTYIESVLKAFEYGKEIINDQEGSDFCQNIFDSIIDPEVPIKYIANKVRPEHTREINECFYVFLAGLCLSATTNDINEMEISIGDYCELLKKINKIVKNLNSDLCLYLNELYIIDELIQIIEYNPNVTKKIIIDIRNYLTENSKIIQKNQSNKNTELEKNFKGMNELLTKIKNNQTEKKYYATIKYIYKKEIQKVNDKIYCSAILEEIIKEKEIIKISNDLFQLLLDSNMKDYKELKDHLLKSKDIIIIYLDKKLSDESHDFYLALSDTLLYFFEKNSLMYLKDEDEDKEDPKLKIFKKCNKFLDELQKDKIASGLTYITKLFCIGYIKSFCYTFIKNHDKKKFNPEDIIKVINKSDEINMIKLYIYKIIFNKYNKQINVFLNSNIINKYKLDTYDGFNDFIKQEEIEKLEQFSYENKESSYKDIYKKLGKFKKEQFEKPITLNDISSNEEVNFDDFYMAADKLIFSNLDNEEFEEENSYINFYKNVCEPLFGKNSKLISLMKYIFEKETYLKFKDEYKINSKDIKALLYGYRYCLNEVEDKEEGNFIYSYLYKRNSADFHKKFYPGNDNKEDPRYELYNKIINHFKEKPDEGCYVCLCDKGYYHSVKGFPGSAQVGMKCDNCGKEIGAKEVYIKEINEKDENKPKYIKQYEMIKSNNNYFRIFKDNEEIRKLKLEKDNYKQFEKLNYMTIEEFKKKYILPLYSKEKGLNEIDIDNFKKQNKIIRNLSQISYRLLNYILYCHLFFAKFLINSDRYDKYLPKGMTWFNMIKECFNRLKVELSYKGIDNIEIFMACVFKDLFEELHIKECINNFEDLIKFEDELEKIIQKKCEEAKKEINKYKELEKNLYKDEKSAIALLKELYDKDKYSISEYPYYEHFYYTDYLDEDYINNILKGRDENEFPVLSKYLKTKKVKKSKDKEKNKDKYSLDNLNYFNKALNLFYDKYSNQISRQDSERKTIKDSDIYIEENNKKSIDKFIKIYNSFELKDSEGNILELNVENKICDFLLIDDNKYGKSYKEIYKKFINKQNEELEDLLNKKISSGEFNNNCKERINVQQIKKNEIFILSKSSNFIEILFNSSYRKYIDTKKQDDYKEYEIDLKQIEEEMTNSFLKNKKLLNDNLIGFNFNNEVFSNEISDIKSNFKYEKMDINIDDKVVIFNFIKKLAGNNEKYKEIINNFITLIEDLNKKKREKDDKINESTKICDIEIVKNLKNISKDFREIFQDKKQEKDKDNSNANLNVSKIINIFDYYLKLIFVYVKKDIQKYQEKKEIERKKKILDELFKTNEDIQKEDLASAIRLFITLVLYREKEKDKDKKIKTNKKDISDYLKNKDLWNSSLYNNTTKFKENLSKIKELNIKIKEILYFYYYLVDNKDEGFSAEVEKYIKDEEEKKKKNNGSNTTTKKPGNGGNQSSDESDDESSEDSGEESDDKSDSDSSDSEKKKKKKNEKKNKNKNKKDHSDSEEGCEESDDDSEEKKKVKKGKKKAKNKESSDSDSDSDN